jgi:hypothetical protein
MVLLTRIVIKLEKLPKRKGDSTEQIHFKSSFITDPASITYKKTLKERA